MNKYSPYYDLDEEQAKMSIDENGSWVHITEIERLRDLIKEAEYGNHSQDGDSCPWCGLVAIGQRYTVFKGEPAHANCPAFTQNGEVK